MKLSHISTELDGMSFAHCCCPLSSVHIVLCLLNCGMFTKDEDDSTTGQLTKLKLDCYGRSSSWTVSLPLSLVPCPMHAREKVRVVYINISGPKECHHSLPTYLHRRCYCCHRCYVIDLVWVDGREGGVISLSSTHVAMDHVGSWTVQHNNEMPPNVLLEKSQIGTRLIARSSTMDLWKRSGGWDGMV